MISWIALGIAVGGLVFVLLQYRIVRRARRAAVNARLDARAALVDAQIAKGRAEAASMRAAYYVDQVRQLHAELHAAQPPF